MNMPYFEKIIKLCALQPILVLELVCLPVEMATWDLLGREEQREMRKSYCLLARLQSTTIDLQLPRRGTFWNRRLIIPVCLILVLPTWVNPAVT